MTEPAWLPLCHRLRATLLELALQLLAYCVAAHSSHSTHCSVSIYPLPPRSSTVTSKAFCLECLGILYLARSNMAPVGAFCESCSHRGTPWLQTQKSLCQSTTTPSHASLSLHQGYRTNKSLTLAETMLLHLARSWFLTQTRFSQSMITSPLSSPSSCPFN